MVCWDPAPHSELEPVALFKFVTEAKDPGACSCETSWKLGRLVGSLASRDFIVGL